MASLRYRSPNSPRVLGVRVLKPEDLEFLRQKSCVTSIKKLRDSHHMIARMVAFGLKQSEIAERVGYSATRVSILVNTPSVKELIEKYRGIVTEAMIEGFSEIIQAKNRITMKSLRAVEDRLDESAEAAEEGYAPGQGLRMRDRDIITITADSLDRTGHGKVSTNVNVNVDFASRLEAARRRVLAGAKAAPGDATIEGTTNPSEAA